MPKSRPDLGTKKLDAPAQIFALSNQKGGCAKTTSAVNIAAGLARAGYPTLLIDLDSQCNSTTTFNLDPDHERSQHPTVIDIYLKGVLAKDTLSWPKKPKGQYQDPNILANLRIIPGHRHVDQARTRLEAELQAAVLEQGMDHYEEQAEREGHRKLLKRSLESISHQFDFVVIDTAPALDFLLMTALEASRWYIIPVFASGYDLAGLSRLTRTVDKVREHGNPSLELLGVLVGNVATNTKMTSSVTKKLEKEFGKKLFETQISQATALRETTVYNTTIYEYAEDSKTKATEKSAKQFKSLVKEITRTVTKRLRGSELEEEAHEVVAQSDYEIPTPEEHAREILEDVLDEGGVS